MEYLLIASGVGLVIGFPLGVFVMALVKVTEPIPTPDARHLHPFRQERDAALPPGHRQEAVRNLGRRFHRVSRVPRGRLRYGLRSVRRPCANVDGQIWLSGAPQARIRRFPRQPAIWPLVADRHTEQAQRELMSHHSTLRTSA